MHREEHMARQSLAQNGGLRIWLVHIANDPYNIIGTCKTIHRDLLVRDGESREVRKEKGYVVGGVVTDKRYRGQGIASFLLNGVKDWLDAEGAVASMIYCSTSLQEVYVQLKCHMNLYSLTQNQVLCNSRLEAYLYTAICSVSSSYSLLHRDL